MVIIALDSIFAWGGPLFPLLEEEVWFVEARTLGTSTGSVRLWYAVPRLEAR